MEMLNASPHFLLSNPFSLLLPLLLFIISAIIILYHVYSSTQRRNGGILPAGSEGLPFIGETLSLIAALKSENPESFTDARARRYGRVFTTHVFGERTVFSSDPDFNRLVLNGEGRSFENSYHPSFAALFGRNALLLMKEPLHGRIHSLTTNHFSSMSVLRDSLLPKIDRLVRGTLNSWQDGQTVMLLDQAKKMSFYLIIMQLISEDPSEWTETLRREYLLLVDGLVSLPLPSFLSSFSTYGKALRARVKLAEALLVFVRERRAKKREVSNDMLDVVTMMEDGLDDDGVVDFLLSIVVAGYDTTSTVMTTAIKFLTDNPPALARLKEEHEQIMRAKKNHDDPLEWSDYQSMTFTQCVINVTLRLTNFAVGVLRRATTDIHFKGYTIPKGCKVFPWFVALHLNAENFKDPKAFDSWRWQSANSTTENIGKIITPFRGGPRLCPGNKLGRLQISVFLHYFVTRLEWEATEKDDLVFFPTPRTPKGYPIIVKWRPLSYGH